MPSVLPILSANTKPNSYDLNSFILHASAGQRSMMQDAVDFHISNNTHETGLAGQPASPSRIPCSTSCRISWDKPTTIYDQFSSEPEHKRKLFDITINPSPRPQA